MKKLPKHDNIIKLFEIYELETEIILVFQLIDGGDLYKYLKMKYVYSEQEACYIFCHILKAVKFLHSNGIVHRDLKPDNVLISKDYKSIKLADFSLAEFYKDKHLNIECGTPGYMAPEIFLKSTYDQSVDIFSLGIILYMLYRK